MFTFSWNIANFELYLAIGKRELQSPTFEVTHLDSTRWFLRLQAFIANEKEAFMQLFLHRAMDNGSEFVTVTYSMLVVDVSPLRLPKHLFSLCVTDDFRKVLHSDVEGLPARNSNLAWRRVIHFPNYLLNLECTVFMDTRIPQRPILYEWAELNTLSQDFENLYESQQFSDIVVCSAGEKRRVHKVILYARAPGFTRKLDGAEISIDTEASVVRLLLRYLYSGKLEPCISDLPTGLYIVAEKYLIYHLIRKLYCQPCICIASTTIPNETQHVDWHIINFFQLKRNVQLFTPIFCDENVLNSELRLNLNALQSEFGDQTIRISVHRVSDECDKHLAMSMEIIMKLNRKLIFNLRRYLVFKPQDNIRLFATLDLRPLFEKYIYDYSAVYCVTLECEFKIFDFRATSEGQTQFSEAISPNTLEDFRGLLVDLYHLYIEGTFCDLSIHTKNTEFQAHKAILWTRVPKFAEMLMTDPIATKCTDVLDMPSLDDDAMGMLLLYLYTGSFKDKSYESVKKLYSASAKLQFFHLKETCSRFLKSCVNLENAEEILQLAIKYTDHALMKNIQSYISAERQICCSTM